MAVRGRRGDRRHVRRQRHIEEASLSMDAAEVDLDGGRQEEDGAQARDVAARVFTT